MTPNDLGDFKGIETSGGFWQAVQPNPQARQRAARYWRVRTYTVPSTVGTFVAGSVGRGDKLVLRFANVTVVMLNDKGRVVPSGLRCLVGLLSYDEVLLLQCFGVNLTKLIRRST
jgi:hypothetical protein